MVLNILIIRPKNLTGSHVAVSRDLDLSDHLLIFLVLLSYIYQTKNMIF